ncbi:hypothetical protein Aperf_G00000098985 [Anoplocephala perfoliata]
MSFLLVYAATYFRNTPFRSCLWKFTLVVRPEVEATYRQKIYYFRTHNLDKNDSLLARSLLFIFNPCHALTAVQVWLLFAKPSSFTTAIFRLHLHGINGALLALVFPTMATRKPALRVIYFIQHILILLIPACILDQNSAYSIEPLADFHWVFTSMATQVLYHFLFLQPLAIVSCVNLNQMLCPSVHDPFAGPYYRIAAMIHQPILILILGKLYSIVVLWLQQCIKSPKFLKPLISSLQQLLELATILGNQTKDNPQPIVCESKVERRSHSPKELFQTNGAVAEVLRKKGSIESSASKL